MQEGKAGSISSELNHCLAWAWGSRRASSAQLGRFFSLLFRLSILVSSAEAGFSVKQINFFSPEGHLKSVSEGPHRECEMPTVISRSCFWKPKFKSLARKELPFDLKHKNSNKSSLSPDHPGLSFLWTAAAFDSWMPAKTPIFPSEKHILSGSMEGCVCPQSHEKRFLWVQRWEGTLQAALHCQASLRGPWPPQRGKQPWGASCPGLKLALHVVKREEHRMLRLMTGRDSKEE